MRVGRRRGLQPFARDASEPVDQRPRAVQRRDVGRARIDRVAADAAALLVPGEIVAVDLGFDGLDARDEASRDVRRQEFGEKEERALLREGAAQRRRIEAAQPRRQVRIQMIAAILTRRRLGRTVRALSGLRRNPGQASPAPDGGLAVIGLSRRSTRR